MKTPKSQRSSIGSVHALICAVVLLSGGCSSGSNAPQEPLADEGEAVSNAVASEVEPVLSLEQQLLESIGSRSGGLSVLLRTGGESRRAVAGSADADGNPLTPQSVFRVGSISKTFVATIVMQLVEEGQVELDRPLSDYLPEATVGSDAMIRDLLAHRAGVANYTAESDFFPTVSSDRSRVFEPAEIVDFVRDSPRDTSGEFAYSNTHYVLLGQLIEALDGGSLQGSLERRITGPLGLDTTQFLIRDEDQPSALVPAWSRGLSEGRFDAPYTSISSSAWAAGALVSSVPELEIFLDALLDGTLVQASTLDQMTQFGPEEYGLGLGEYELDSQTSAVGHNGSIPGYLSVMVMTADRDTAVIVLTNNDAIDPDRVGISLLENEAREMSE